MPNESNMNGMQDPEIDPVLSHVTERDIDLILVEELRCSGNMQKLFLSSMVGDSDPSIQVIADDVIVRHSQTRGGPGAGETDIEAVLSVRDKQEIRKILLLIENKIDADFQDRQPERYRLRAENADWVPGLSSRHTVLVAPNEYLESQVSSTEFDGNLSYEEIVAYFEEESARCDGQSAKRMLHKRKIIEQAIHKYRRGYVADVDVGWTQFWEEYYGFVQREVKTLGMRRPGPKPIGSTWVHFPDALTADPPIPSCVIKHKLTHGRVDLEFAGCAQHGMSLTSALGHLIDKNMTVRRAGKSLAISITVPRIQETARFSQQENAVREGIDAARRLQDWFHSHSQELSGCFDGLTSQ